MNPKFERYLEAKRAGKSNEDCVRAALPGVDEKSTRFNQWVEFAEVHYTDIKNAIALEGLNKPKEPVKKTPAKKPAKAPLTSKEVE